MGAEGSRPLEVLPAPDTGVRGADFMLRHRRLPEAFVLAEILHRLTPRPIRPTDGNPAPDEFGVDHVPSARFQSSTITQTCQSRTEIGVDGMAT